MLSDINIRNFALIDELDLELGKGMCVLTGETGAGKSILVDALGMVLGDRADSTTIRSGASRAEITLGLDVSQLADVKNWLQEHDLGHDNRCILRRVINRDGPSKAYINDSPATVTVLKSLGEMLVDIHGQHVHQSLLRRDVQRQLLDNHAGNERRLAQLAALYRTWQGLNMKLQSLLANSGEHQSRADLLRFQIQELEALGLREGELETLASEHQRLANAERLQSSCMQAYSALYESDDASIYSQLARLVHELDELHNLDDVLGEYHDLLVDAQLQIQEAANGVRRYSERLVNDRQQLEQVENRITAIHDLARKHRVAAEELPQLLAHMQHDLATLENPEYDVAKVRARLEEVDVGYRKLASKISRARHKAADELHSAISKTMQEIGMEGGKFHIEVTPRGDGQLSPSGLDLIELRVSTNPGQPLMPLSKVVSGGELSRISLAIQINAATNLDIPTLVFDEVDAGIGGRVAEVVGRQLAALGSRRQVLCVTHLPQVAVQAHNHYQVSKVKDGPETLICIAELDADARKREVARMLGGIEMTDNTLSHAEEMISRARLADQHG